MSQRKKEGSREWEDQVKIHERVQERHTTGIGTEGSRKGKRTYEECGKLHHSEKDWHAHSLALGRVLPYLLGLGVTIAV